VKDPDSIYPSNIVSNPNIFNNASNPKDNTTTANPANPGPTIATPTIAATAIPTTNVSIADDDGVEPSVTSHTLPIISVEPY
jgi:hypothetical protein